MFDTNPVLFAWFSLKENQGHKWCDVLWCDVMWCQLSAFSVQAVWRTAVPSVSLWLWFACSEECASQCWQRETWPHPDCQTGAFGPRRTCQWDHHCWKCPWTGGKLESVQFCPYQFDELPVIPKQHNGCWFILSHVMHIFAGSSSGNFRRMTTLSAFCSSDLDSECDGDHGAQAGGWGHPTAALAAVWCVPWCGLLSQSDDRLATRAAQGVQRDAPHVRWKRRARNTVGGEGEHWSAAIQSFVVAFLFTYCKELEDLWN